MGFSGAMGITFIDDTVRGPGSKEVSVRFLINSGAMYSMLPKPAWESIRLVAKQEMSLGLADGTTKQRWMLECYFSFPQGDGHAPVILEDSGADQALLGVVTLEVSGLEFNPISRPLQAMRVLA